VIEVENQTHRPEYPSNWLYLLTLLLVIILLVGLLTGTLLSYLDAVVIAFLGFLVISWVGVAMSKPIDSSWLPAMIAIGYLAKIMASLARYLVLFEFYGGGGDAQGYHGSGVQFAPLWRNFQIPPGMGDLGTGFVDGLTGLIYAPYIPKLLGGFFIFATIAFIGQLLMYAAFRRTTQPRRLKWYAMAIFFVPAITYWPASIGKESLMFLGIGLAVYGASLFLDQGGIKPLVFMAAGLGFAGAIRPHISALIVGSLAVTLVLARGRPSLGMSPWVRWLAVLVIGAASFFLVTFALTEFNIDLGGDVTAEVDEFVSTVEDNTSKGGSEVDGGAVTGIQDVPDAALRVLFRPLPYEAHNMAAMASALESTAILLILIWRSPKIFKNLRYIRRDPYVLMCLVMTLGFIVMFSPFLNLGLLARERSQILPFLAVLVIQLGWNFPKESDESPGPHELGQRAKPPSYAS
jgi:hypothetical protein